jgi:hypothetical protein
MTFAFTPRERADIDAAAFANLDADQRRQVRARFLAALVSSKWYHRKAWPLVVVCCAPGAAPRVVLRAELAQEFRNTGDEASAHEVLARRVPPGSVLAWIVVDSEDAAGSGFVVVQLVGGGR